MKIVMCGVGGQGVLLATSLIGKAAMKKGIDTKMCEVHGMAQRGGTVVAHLVLSNDYSPLIGKGQADAILSFEPAETFRFLELGNINTHIIINSSPIIPFTVALGLSKYPIIPEATKELKKDHSHVITIDAISLAKEAGARIAANVVLVGALASIPNFPLSMDELKAEVKSTVKERFIETNLKALELGYKNAKELRQ